MTMPESSLHINVTTTFLHNEFNDYSGAKRKQITKIIANNKNEFNEKK